MVIFKKFKTKTGDEIILRGPKKEDLNGFYNLINNAAKEDTFIILCPSSTVTLKEEKKWLDSLLEKVKKQKKLSIVAEAGNVLVGHCEFTLKDKRLSHVAGMGIVISKDFREMGIGTEMLKIGFEWLKKKKCKIVTFDVFSDNSHAIHIYEKFGMKECGRIPKALKYKNRYI